MKLESKITEDGDVFFEMKISCPTNTVFYYGQVNEKTWIKHEKIVFNQPYIHFSIKYNEMEIRNIHSQSIAHLLHRNNNLEKIPLPPCGKKQCRRSSIR